MIDDENTSNETTPTLAQPAHGETPDRAVSDSGDGLIDGDGLETVEPFNKKPTAVQGTEPRAGEGQQTDQAPSRRYMAIEADEAQRERIKRDPNINPQHLCTLKGLVLLRNSDEEKDRIYLSTLDPESSAILDELLDVAIGEMNEENATVVGLVDILIERALDICGAIRSQSEGGATNFTD